MFHSKTINVVSNSIQLTKPSLFVQNPKKSVQLSGARQVRVVSQNSDQQRLAQLVVIISGVRINNVSKLTIPLLKLMADGEIGRIGVNVPDHVTREFNRRFDSVTIQVQPMEASTALEKELVIKFVIQIRVPKKSQGRFNL